MDPRTVLQVTPEELQKVAKDAADKAVADNEELMEAVMQETVRLLRAEFLETIKKETTGLKQAVAKLTEQQLDFAVKEQVNKQIANLLSLCSQIKDDICVQPISALDDKRISDLQVDASQIKSDSITRSELEATTKKTLSALQAHGAYLSAEFNSELSKIKSLQEASQSILKEVAARDYVDKQISGLRECVSQIKGEPLNDSKMQEIQAKLPQDIVSEADKQNIDKQFSDLRSHVSEIQERLAQHADKVGTVTRADLDGTREFLIRQVTEVSENVQDLRNVVDGFERQVSRGSTRQVSKESTRGDLDFLGASEVTSQAKKGGEFLLAKKQALQDAVTCKFLTEDF